MKGFHAQARKRQRGFSIIEIIIAILLVAVAIIGLATMTSTNTQTSDFSKTMTSATTLAGDKIEELKGRDYDTLAGGTDTSGIYARSWVLASSPSPHDYKVITVTVTWNWQGKSHKVELKTIRTKD
jgi:prepilin-type N-terminal cleavage/methylation domain-containing protein